MRIDTGTLRSISKKLNIEKEYRIMCERVQSKPIVQLDDMSNVIDRWVDWKEWIHF